ncbi:hypothetical protein ABW19_dt0208081 [Dactylella cylindrospora]|nr:hypothetical protein ABW19_dt0208081 [Dactylella cylindrospora]
MKDYEEPTPPIEKSLFTFPLFFFSLFFFFRLPFVCCTELPKCPPPTNHLFPKVPTFLFIVVPLPNPCACLDIRPIKRPLAVPARVIYSRNWRPEASPGPIKWVRFGYPGRRFTDSIEVFFSSSSSVSHRSFSFLFPA